MQPGSAGLRLCPYFVWSMRRMTSLEWRSAPMNPVSRCRNSVTACAATEVVNGITAGARVVSSGAYPSAAKAARLLSGKPS